MLHSDKSRPAFGGKDRADEALRRRKAASELATMNGQRQTLEVPHNGESQKYDALVTTFSKGLVHNHYGIPENVTDYATMVEKLTQPPSGAAPWAIDAEFDVPIAGDSTPASCKSSQGGNLGHRQWESPLAGHYYTIEGPDPDGVAMAPAPRLGESELCAELAELYAMALVRDIPFNDLEDGETALSGSLSNVQGLVDSLNSLSWFNPGKQPVGGLQGSIATHDLSEHEIRRRESRGEAGVGLTPQTLFRGSTPGCNQGPYISQFFLIGTESKKGGTLNLTRVDGKIAYGAQRIDQRVEPAKAGLDYMTSWAEWLDVQNGLDLRGTDKHQDLRFIETPRDLAAFVHFDQLHQAYFDTCLILLEGKTKLDAGFPESEKKTRAGFAAFGGPHILTLLSEVPSRALRAVRRQKFLVHRRARPEHLAAMLTLYAHEEYREQLGNAKDAFKSMFNELWGNADAKPTRALLEAISAHNTEQNGKGDERDYKCDPMEGLPEISDAANFLLPMAFPEGSPMHPAYGAGHATVAGACITVIKAFFQLHDPASQENDTGWIAYKMRHLDGEGATKDFIYRAPAGGGDKLDAVEVAASDALTIEGELNKLAANVAIGRNFAGVHYYTDYYDSLRMGERVAFGILQEQMMSYPEKVSFRFRSFDGDYITMTTNGTGDSSDATTTIINQDGKTISLDEWWTRSISEFGTSTLTGNSPPELLAAAASSNWKSA